MTQSVAQKNSVSEKTWRRQTDSPGWWIAFSCGSVILHLLAFWLISLYELNLSQQRRLAELNTSGVTQSVVPIEFIDISPQESSQPQPQIKPKPIPPQPSNTRTTQTAIIPQNSQPPVNPSTVNPPVASNDRNDRNAIAFDNQKIEQQLRQQELEQQRQLEAILRQQAEQLRQRQAQQQQLETQIRQQELEQQQQLQAKIRQQEAEQRRLAQQSKLEAEEQRQLATQQQPQTPLDGEKIADAPTNALGQTPQQRTKTSSVPIQETQLNRTGGILTASWNVVPYKQKTDIPDNAPQIKENISQTFVIPASQENDLQPVEFQVFLTIDEQGNVEELFIDPSTTGQEREKYQTYVDQNLKNKKLFDPATDLDPTTGELKPRKSNLLIRVKIQPES